MFFINLPTLSLDRCLAGILLTAGFLSGGCSPWAKPVNPMKVLVVPGHLKEDSYKGAAGYEYILNYRVAQRLELYLQQDDRMVHELSRARDHFLPPVLDILKRHKKTINGFLNIRTPLDKRSPHLGNRMRRRKYATRFYARHAEFDYLISIHFNYVWPPFFKPDRHRGFHLIISPFNEKFDESLTLAMFLRDELKRLYPVHLDGVYPIRWKHISSTLRRRYDIRKIHRMGISLRSLVILGDIYETLYFQRHPRKRVPAPDIPSVLVECGFLHNTRFLRPQVQHRLAGALYRGLVRYQQKKQTVP